MRYEASRRLNAQFSLNIKSNPHIRGDPSSSSSERTISTMGSLGRHLEFIQPPYINPLFPHSPFNFWNRHMINVVNIVKFHIA